MVEMDEKREEPDLEQLLAQLDQDKLDLILVEGFKHERFPKIEVHRPSLNHPLFRFDPSIIAIASDAPEPTDLPLLDMNQPAQIVAFIEERLLGG